jgi:hypothetical protein
MSGTEVAGLIESIDLSIADNKKRVESEVASYIEENQDSVVAEIAEHGFVTIPTSTGDVKITEEQLEAVAA